MKQREKQAELKLLQLEDEIQRREAKIKQLEFILKTERDMNLKELNQRRSMVPNLEQIIVCANFYGEKNRFLTQLCSIIDF
jgi:hypothetical protein